MKWSRLTNTEKLCGTFLAVCSVLYILFKFVSVPVLYMERMQNSVGYLSNRVDEISYKQDLLLELLEPRKKLATVEHKGLNTKEVQ